MVYDACMHVCIFIVTILRYYLSARYSPLTSGLKKITPAPNGVGFGSSASRWPQTRPTSTTGISGTALQPMV